MTQAAFPASQQLARSTDLVIAVRNPGSRPIPNINVTVKCQSGLGSSFQTASPDPEVADPRRPQFVVNTIPTLTTPSSRRPLLDPAPIERSSALVDTYPLGELRPGDSATFRWNVTAVKVGGYRVCYHVNADLYGDARAVPISGSLPLSGAFTGEISSAAPKACVGSNDQTVVTTGCR